MTVFELVDQVKNLSEKEKEEFFSNFCRSCHTVIDDLDWSGRNYCASCSPDPDSRD